MSNEEIVKLIQQGVDIKKNQELLYLKNKGFIARIIKNCSGEGDDFEDLMQQGFIGLITAASKYKPDAGANFLTYAAYHIKSSIYRYVENCGSVVRVPSFMKHRIRKYLIFKNRFKDENHRYPTTEEYCNFFKLPLAALQHLEKAIYQIQTVSLDSYVGSHEDNTELIEFIANDDNVEEAVAGSIYLKELHQSLNKALDKLDKREKAMVICKFYQNFSYGRVANVFQCSKQNVYDRIAKAFLKILNDKQMVEELLSFMPEGYDNYEFAYNTYANKSINEENSNFLI